MDPESLDDRINSAVTSYMALKDRK